MNNRELISKLSAQTEGEYSRMEVSEVVEALIEVITEVLSRGESINITGIGKFTVKELQPRRYYNVHSGKMEMSTTQRVVVFTPSIKLQNRLDGDQ